MTPEGSQDNPPVPALKRFYFPKVEFRLGVAALIAILLQLVAVFAPLPSDDVRRALFVFSYLSILVFIAFNIRRVSLVILGIGVVLNFIPVLANGGLMPLTPETALKTGDLPEGVEIGEWVPYSKDVLKDREDVRFYFLSDRLTIDGQSVVRAFSVGDIVIVAGVAVTVADLLLPRYKRSGPAQAPNGEKHTSGSHV